MFASPAYAQAAGGAPGGGDFIIQLVPLLLIFVIFYFFLIRPQQKKAKEHKAMVENLRRGDQVITQGGVHAKVTKVSDDEVEVEIAQGVKIRIVKSTVVQVLAKTGPVNDN